MKQGIGWCLVILAAGIGASNALNVTTFEKIGDLPNSPDSIVRCVNGSVYNIDTKFNFMAEFDLASNQWISNLNFKSIKSDGYFDDYFVLGNRIFAISIPDNFTIALGPSFFYWDKDAGEFKSLRVDIENAMPNSTSTPEIYWAIGVPDKAGSDAYLAMTIRGSPTSDTVISKFHVEFNGSIPSNGEMRGLHRASLPANNTVLNLILRENVLYWFVRTVTPIKHLDILDPNYGFYFNLTSNATGNFSTTSNGVDIFPFRGSYLVGDNHLLISGNVNPKPNRPESKWSQFQPVWWNFEFGSNRWTLIKDEDSWSTGYNFDMDDGMLYVVSSTTGVRAASIKDDGVLNITAFAKIGNSSHISLSSGFSLYVNGSVYLIQKQTMMEFDIATKQWAPNRNFPSILRDGYERDYFSLGNRIFAILIPRNIIGDSSPLFFFWDKDAGEFKSLRVYVDPNAMPNSTSTSDITWAISVPDNAGSDAYLAMTCLGSSTSDAVFSNLHVEFNGSIPISGEMRGFHRVSLPTNITIEYLVLRENALYWFLKAYTPDEQLSVLDTDHVFYYNLTTNATGNISIFSNNGTYYAPWPESYLIGDKHALTFGRFNQTNPPLEYKKGQFVMWLFDFDSTQWTAFTVNHAGFKGMHWESVDMVNRLVHQLTNRGVYVAKIVV